MDKNIKNILDKLPSSVMYFYNKNSEENITEIRIRKGFDIKVCVNGDYYIIPDTVVGADYIDKLFYSFCENTVSAYEEQTSKGFITLPGGHRIGLGGKFTTDEKGKTVITEIYSMNIRLAKFHQIIIDDELINFEKGLLISGRPHSGKTTFLKNICSKLQDKNLAVCDERNELYFPELCCDYIINIPKEKAILQVLRTLNPDYIICDELGEEDSDVVLNGVTGGAKFICSIHCNSMAELIKKPNISALLNADVFDRIIFLDNNGNNFYIREVIDV